jgi:hypothetical protein
MEKNVKGLHLVLSAMIIFAFLLAPLTMSAQTGKASFAGTWALNAEKSNFGQPPQGQGQPPQGQGQGQGQGGGQRMGGFGGGNLTVAQEDNLLTVSTTRTGQDGQTQTNVSKYTLDGKESINTTQRGESKSTATWSADGKTLTIVTTRTFNDRTMTTKEEWSLLSPASLSRVSTTNTQNGERTMKMVYDKK